MEFRFVQILLLLSIHLSGFTQLIPNGDFEEWLIDRPNQSYPKYWEPQNEPELPLIDQARGYNSEFSVRLYVDWDNFQKKYCGASISNNFQVSPPSQYQKMTGYLKGTSGNSDSILFSVKLFNGEELIGTGSKKFLKDSNSWEEFKISLKYTNTKIPDRANITISINTNKGNHKITSYYIDALFFALSEIHWKNNHLI